MTADRRDLPPAEAARYEERFRSSGVLADLLATSGLDRAAAGFERESARQLTGLRHSHPVVLVLVHPGERGDDVPDDPFQREPRHEAVTAEATFAEGTDELLEAELRTGVAAELAGGGRFWQWDARDGEISEGRWRA